MYINKRLFLMLNENAMLVIGISTYELLSSILCCLVLVGWSFFLSAGIDRNPIRCCIIGAVIVLLLLMQSYIEKRIVMAVADNGNIFKKNIRTKLFNKLFLLGPQYVDRKRSGEIITTLWEKIEWLNFYYVEYIPRSMAALIISIAVLLSISFISPASGVTLFFIVCLLFLSPVFFSTIMKGSSNLEWKETDRFYSDCLDGIQGIITLKAFNANERHRKTVNEQAEVMRKTTMNNLIKTTANNKTLELLITSGKYIPLLFSIGSFISNGISIHQLLLVFFLLQAWGNVAEKILGSWLKGHKGISGLDDVFEILTEQSNYSYGEIQDFEPDKNSISGDIEFNNVTFLYQSGKKALDKISVVLKEGTETAIVGASGSGKSTLAQLLFGFYKPQGGQIRINDEPITYKNIYALQSSITAIWQDSHIFNDTCLNNILMAKPDANKDDVVEAAKKANIHDLIMSLPNQYNTVIGNGGHNLSGGEKQRIIIARAFLRNSPILILDEATSSLDRQNEEEIQRCLKNLSEGKTVMTIAHRFETIISSDSICMLQHGKMIANGRHDQLMQTSTEYRTFANLQGIWR